MTDNVAEDTPTCVICGDEMSKRTGMECPLCIHLGRLGMPYGYLESTKHRFGEKMQNYFKSVESLYIHGKVGNGKTWLMSAIMREAVRRSGRPANSYDDTVAYSRHFLFISLPELMMKIKDSMNPKSEVTESQLLDKYSKVSVLFLDDIGADYTTDYVIAFLYLLLERRDTGKKLTTVITSNLSPNELGEKHTERISSRVTGMCRIVRMTGQDRRPERKK